MTTNAATVTEQIQAFLSAAQAAAEKRAFVYPGNFGRGEFRHAVKVTLADHGTAVYLSSETNAQISQERAAQLLSDVYRDALAAAGTVADLRTVKTRGHAVWREGFRCMGRLSTTGFARGVRARSDSDEARQAREWLRLGYRPAAAGVAS